MSVSSAEAVAALQAEIERLRRVLFKRMIEKDVEIDRLRAGLWDIHAICNNWDWFIWMWPIRRIKRYARAALKVKP